MISQNEIVAAGILVILRAFETYHDVIKNSLKALQRKQFLRET